MFNPGVLGSVAKSAQMKQDLKASQNPPADAKEYIIQWPGSPVDGLRATLQSSIHGECIVVLASGRAVSVPPSVLIAAPKTEKIERVDLLPEHDQQAVKSRMVEIMQAKPSIPAVEAEIQAMKEYHAGRIKATDLLAAPKAEKKEAKKDDKKEDEKTEKSKKVVPEDKPDTRGDAAQEEDLTDRAKSKSTEIEKPPVLEHMKKGPKEVPVETARTAPEAGGALKTLVAAAEAAKVATEAALAVAKEAQAKAGEAKSTESKAVQLVVDEMEKTSVVVAKIADKLVALDSKKDVAAVNIPKSGALRVRYEQSLSLLKSIQEQAKEQAKVVKEIEAEAEDQYGATYNVQKRVSTFPASLQAALKAVASFADLVKGLADWVKGLFGMAEEAEVAVDALVKEMGSVEAKLKENVRVPLKKQLKAAKEVACPKCGSKEGFTTDWWALGTFSNFAETDPYSIYDEYEEQWQDSGPTKGGETICVECGHIGATEDFGIETTEYPKLAASKKSVLMFKANMDSLDIGFVMWFLGKEGTIETLMAYAAKNDYDLNSAGFKKLAGELFDESIQISDDLREICNNADEGFTAEVIDLLVDSPPLVEAVEAAKEVKERNESIFSPSSKMAGLKAASSEDVLVNLVEFKGAWSKLADAWLALPDDSALYDIMNKGYPKFLPDFNEGYHEVMNWVDQVQEAVGKGDYSEIAGKKVVAGLKTKASVEEAAYALKNLARAVEAMQIQWDAADDETAGALHESYSPKLPDITDLYKGITEWQKALEEISKMPKVNSGLKDFEARLKARTGLKASEAGIAGEATFKMKVVRVGIDNWISGFIKAHGLNDLAPKSAK